MSLRDIEAFRGNFLIAFAGAALVIFAIKLTPLLLPAKYYFNFSTVMGSGSDPFIVDTPGVTGQKLCAIFAKYDIPHERYPQVKCSLNYASEDEAHAGVPSFSAAEQDKIYTAALQGDPALRQDIREALQQPPEQRVHLSDEEVAEILAQAASVGRAFDALVEGYQSKLHPVVQSAIEARIEQALSPHRPATEEAGEGEQGEDAVASIELSEEVKAKIIDAHRNAVARLGQAQLADAVLPITKSEVDRVIKESYGWGGIDYALSGYYKRVLTDDYVQEVLLDEFKAVGFDVTTKDQARRLIYAEINGFSLTDYVIAILVRLAPVVIVGIILGFLFGQKDILSIGTAGALAAFLLSWPLMLMWDRLVQGSWQDKKNIFLIFYTVYIAVFFLTARTSAMIGAKLEGSGNGFLSRTGAADKPRDPLTWGSIAANIVATVVGNAAIYIGNVIIPLQAMAND